MESKKEQEVDGGWMGGALHGGGGDGVGLSKKVIMCFIIIIIVELE